MSHPKQPARRPSDSAPERADEKEFNPVERRKRVLDELTSSVTGNEEEVAAEIDRFFALDEERDGAAAATTADALRDETVTSPNDAVSGEEQHAGALCALDTDNTPIAELEASENLPDGAPHEGDESAADTLNARALSFTETWGRADAVIKQQTEVLGRALTPDEVQHIHRQHVAATIATAKKATREKIKRGLPSQAAEARTAKDRTKRTDLEKALDDPGQFNVDQEFGTVAGIQAIQDGAVRGKTINEYTSDLQGRLGATAEDAAAIYEHLADNLDVHRALQENKQALLVLDHVPEKFDAFAELKLKGDEEGIDRLFASIEDDAVRESLQRLRTAEKTTANAMALQRQERIAQAEKTFARIRGFNSYSDLSKEALGKLSGRVSPEFLDALEQANLKETPKGLQGEFLDRPLLIDLRATVTLGFAPIETLDAHGVRLAAVRDRAELRNYEVLERMTSGQVMKVIDPLFATDEIEALPTRRDLLRMQSILEALGLKASYEEGYRALREFALINDDFKPNSPGIHRLNRQLFALSHGGQLFGYLRKETFDKLLAYWKAEGSEPRRSTILTAEQLAAL